MPLFNRRNKAGSGEGQMTHVGHTDPFMGDWNGHATPYVHPSQDPFASKPKDGSVPLDPVKHGTASDLWDMHDDHLAKSKEPDISGRTDSLYNQHHAKKAAEIRDMIQSRANALYKGRDPFA
jgi:hypothetical protein